MAIVSNFVLQENRTLKPLLTKTQATFQDWPVDPSERGIFPGMVACMGEDGMRLSTGAERPRGLFATYRSYEVMEVPSIGVLVLGGGAMAEVSRSVIDKDADWDAAETAMRGGARVLLESNEEGRLTVGDGNPVCMLVGVSQSKITVAEAPRTVTGSTPVPESVTLTVGKTDFEGTTYLGKNLGDLTEGLTAQMDGTTVKFGGTINHVPDWTEFSAAEEDRTGYYAVFEMKSDDGAAFVRQTLGSGEKTIVFGQTGDGAGTIGLVAAIQKDVKEFTATLYANADDAASKVNGTEYTFDFTACMFGE
jgi:hypothetical protein